MASKKSSALAHTLKPHGSLNWYNSRDVKHVAKSQRVAILDDERPGERVEAFRSPRQSGPKLESATTLSWSRPGMKDFKRPIFQRLWNNCTNVLSTPRTLIFLGYSLPSADLHAQFIFRCGFHNQFEGRLKPTRGRFKPTGPANVVIVNLTRVRPPESGKSRVWRRLPVDLCDRRGLDGSDRLTTSTRAASRCVLAHAQTWQLGLGVGN